MNAPSNLDIAVVIPLFNKAKFIRAALESVLAQSHPAKEILVIDDGSTDEGVAIVEALRSNRIRLVRQPNAGPGLARNRGIEEASQPWIAFLDADDLWLPDHLAHFAELHRAFPQAAVFAAGYYEFRGEPPSAAPGVGGAREIDFFALDPRQPGLSSSSVLVKREVLESAGGFGPAFPGEDVDLWIRLGLDHTIVLSAAVTALYRRDDEGLTRNYLSGLTTGPFTIFVTLGAALADPRYRDRHDLISRYRDKWRLLLARQSLARGAAKPAQSHLREVARKNAEWLLLNGLAALPSPVLKAAVKARKRSARRERAG